jgi:type VI secretion system secreted protein Hcp
MQDTRWKRRALMSTTTQTTPTTIPAVDNTDFYLKIDSINGEATTQGLTGYMKIVAFNWGGQNSGKFQAGESSGLPSGRFTGGDFNFIMKTNSASPQLMSACAKGTQFASATLVCRKAVGGSTPTTYLQVALSPVLVSKFTTGYDPYSNQGDAIVVDNIALNFGKISVQYKSVTNQGTSGPAVEGGYNLQQGTTA